MLASRPGSASGLLVGNGGFAVCFSAFSGGSGLCSAAAFQPLALRSQGPRVVLEAPRDRERVPVLHFSHTYFSMMEDLKLQTC